MKLTTVADRVIKKLVKLGPKGWIKNTDARNKYGTSVSPLKTSACQFCNEGIVFCVIGDNNPDNSIFHSIDKEFAKMTHSSGMVNFNDRYTTTFGENLEVWFKLRDSLKDRNL